MTFSLTKFTKREASKDYKYIEFIERGLPLAVLIKGKRGKLSSKTSYKFGMITDNNELYWFFKGNSVVKERKTAHKYYMALKMYCDKNNLGKPFLFKD